MQRLLGRVWSFGSLAAFTSARELRLLGQATYQSGGGVAPCSSVGTALPTWHTPQDLVCLRNFAASSTIDELPLITDRQRLVVLGTGWAAARVVTDIDPKHYDLTVWLAHCDLPCCHGRKYGALTSSRRSSSGMICPLLPAGHLTTQSYGDAHVALGSAYSCARYGFSCLRVDWQPLLLCCRCSHHSWPMHVSAPWNPGPWHSPLSGCRWAGSSSYECRWTKDDLLPWLHDRHWQTPPWLVCCSPP